jgi:hypothetical protein
MEPGVKVKENIPSRNGSDGNRNTVVVSTNAKAKARIASMGSGRPSHHRHSRVISKGS